MFKAMILLKRKEGTSRADFAKWLLEQHRPLAEQLPGLKRSVFNLVSEDSPEICDGISELWFESRADFDAAYATDIGNGDVQKFDKNGKFLQRFPTRNIEGEKRFCPTGIALLPDGAMLLADRLATPDHARDLWRHWDEPTLTWYQGGHMTFGARPEVKSHLDNAFRGLALAGT